MIPAWNRRGPQRCELLTWCAISGCSHGRKVITGREPFRSGRSSAIRSPSPAYFDRSINFVENIPGDLPYAVGDPGQLAQLSLNLLLNARDAVEKTDRTISRIEVAVDEAWVDADDPRPHHRPAAISACASTMAQVWRKRLAGSIRAPLHYQGSRRGNRIGFGHRLRHRTATRRVDRVRE